MTKIQRLLKKLSAEKINIISLASLPINSTVRLIHLNEAIKAIHENRIILPANDCVANNIFLECVLRDGEYIQHGKMQTIKARLLSILLILSFHKKLRHSNLLVYT